MSSDLERLENSRKDEAKKRVRVCGMMQKDRKLRPLSGSANPNAIQYVPEGTCFHVYYGSIEYCCLTLATSIIISEEYFSQMRVSPSSNFGHVLNKKGSHLTMWDLHVSYRTQRCRIRHPVRINVVDERSRGPSSYFLSSVSLHTQVNENVSS